MKLRIIILCLFAALAAMAWADNHVPESILYFLKA